MQNVVDALKEWRIGFLYYESVIFANEQRVKPLELQK